MCDLENVSQCDIFEVTHARSQVFMKEMTVSMHFMSYLMCDLESASQNGCVMCFFLDHSLR